MKQVIVESAGVTYYCEYDPPDMRVGYTGNAWLVRALAGNVDVTDLIKDRVVQEVERLACEQVNKGEQ